MLIAHINKDKTRTQSVSEHCRKTAEKAALYAKKLNLSKTAKLQGLLHDMGKLCLDFSEYIAENNNIKRGEKIDHAYAGVKYLTEVSSHSNLSSVKGISGYVSRTIISHHGLHDWLRENSKSYFDERISETKRYDEILKNRSEVFSDEEITELLNDAADEYRQYFQKIKQCADNDQQKLLFYSGLFERMLQSILIDADRTDTADFMLGRSVEASGREKFSRTLFGLCPIDRR